MMLATMRGEGRNTSRERRLTMMMRPAALSLGSTARRLISWLPSLPVEPSSEKAVSSPIRRENWRPQSNGQ